MEVIPAIDLRGGQVVRLYQGDFRKEKVYSLDPVAVAKRWQEEGAPRIHIVDLDGAKAGRLVNIGVIKEIASQVTIPLQVGGGVRDIDTAIGLLRMGVQRVVFGTAAVRDPGLVRRACEELGREAVLVGVDCRGGKVVVEGWLQQTSKNPKELMLSLITAGVERFIYTDTATDGTLAGPNVEAVAALMKAVGKPIISSGGISSMDDLHRLAEAGVEGAIVGSALYKGAIDLRQAVSMFGS